MALYINRATKKAKTGASGVKSMDVCADFLILTESDQVTPRRDLRRTQVTLYLKYWEVITRIVL